MLCSHDYSTNIDVWSIGCTFAELLRKNFLFPGDNYLTQIKLILECLGAQNEDDMSFITNIEAKDYVKSFCKLPKVCINKYTNYTIIISRNNSKI